MRRKCRYIAVLCAAACVGAGAPAQAFAQEAGGTDCAGTEVTFTAGNDGAMTAAAESGKIAPVKYEKGSYVVGRDIPARQIHSIGRQGKPRLPGRHGIAALQQQMLSVVERYQTVVLKAEGSNPLLIRIIFI